MIISASTDYRAAAQRKLPPFLFHYIDGGAYAEHTLRRNVADLADIALRQRVLRNMGKDTFVVTGDVVRCLRRANIDINENPTSQREMRLIQGAFNDWHLESSVSYAAMSRICALSVDSPGQ